MANLPKLETAVMHFNFGRLPVPMILSYPKSEITHRK